MAVTFAVSNLVKSVAGSQRMHTGKLTATGTPTDNGDALSPSAIGLAFVEDLQLSPAISTTDNPEGGLVAKWNKDTGLVNFYVAHTTPGTNVALIEFEGDVTNYTARFIAFGK